VNIGRLRQKLKEFYDVEGRTYPLRIWIPLGGHELDVRENPENGTVVSPHIPAVVPTPSRDRTLVLSIILAVASLLCVAQFFAYRYRALSVPKTPTVIPQFWRSFTSNGKPTQLFLSAPVFFEWNTKSVKVRDPAVNDFADLKNSRQFKAMVAQLGPPRLMQNYTTVGDSLAALKFVAVSGQGQHPCFVRRYHRADGGSRGE
jgi:hypothetical protein